MSTPDILDIFVPHILGIDYINANISKDLPGKGKVKTVRFTEWQLCSLKAALNSAGITTFAQFQTMRANHFEQMIYPGKTGPMRLPVYTAAQASLVVAFYHHVRVKTVKSDDDLVKPEFLGRCQKLSHDFQTLEYDPDSPIVPWRRRLERGNQDDKKALEAWNKNIRLSPKDFPIFKDCYLEQVSPLVPGCYGIRWFETSDGSPLCTQLSALTPGAMQLDLQDAAR